MNDNIRETAKNIKTAIAIIHPGFVFRGIFWWSGSKRNGFVAISAAVTFLHPLQNVLSLIKMHSIPAKTVVKKKQKRKSIKKVREKTLPTVFSLRSLKLMQK